METKTKIEKVFESCDKTLNTISDLATLVQRKIRETLIDRAKAISLAMEIQRLFDTTGNKIQVFSVDFGKTIEIQWIDETDSNDTFCDAQVNRICNLESEIYVDGEPEFECCIQYLSADSLQRIVDCMTSEQARWNISGINDDDSYDVSYNTIKSIHHE